MLTNSADILKAASAVFKKFLKVASTDAYERVSENG
jgi:hypothetical protein